MPEAAAQSFDTMQAQFVDARAIATNHMITLRAIRDNFPNTETLAMLQKTERTLKEERDTLTPEIKELETTAGADDTVFAEKAPPLTGQPREKVYTLQDYILAILTLAFTFFFISFFFYMGKRTGWNKKTLLYIVGAALIVVILGYSLLRVYA